MNKKKKAQAETFTNSSCRDLGHAWAITTADNYRKCSRDKCKAAQRLVRGQWVNALQERPWTDPRIEWARKGTMPKQVALFSYSE
jgi:hypothetical protein